MNGLHSLSDYHKNEYFCNVLIPSEDTKILEFNQKSDKAPFFYSCRSWIFNRKDWDMLK